MISNFFSKTKPINYAVLFGAIFLLYWLFVIVHDGLPLLVGNIVANAGVFLALLAAIYLLGLSSRTNKLTGVNSFAMFFFTLLLIGFPDVLDRPSFVYASLLILISSDRALLIKTDKHTKHRIFEASLCVFVACFFYEWSVLYLFPIYASMSLFQAGKVRVWLMPIAAFATALLCGLAVTSVFGSTQLLWDRLQFKLQFDFFTDPDYGFLVYAPLSLVLAAVVFWKLGYRRLGRTLSLRIVLAYLVISLLLAFFTDSTPYIGLFSFFAVAIFLANLIEIVQRERLKELLLVLAIVLAITGYIFKQLQ